MEIQTAKPETNNFNFDDKIDQLKFVVNLVFNITPPTIWEAEETLD